ncbi:hypothetical protein V2I01_15130 [Micromonospora sp. BRA006-A]|nr:hypothetical protein [Micromonospora sp. BRA006-A]
MVQETWLRWAGVDLDEIRDRRAYLVRIATRQALSRLRTLGRRKGVVVRRLLAARATAHRARRRRRRDACRERVDGDAAGAGDAHADRAGRVRAAEVFDVGYDEIAETVERTPVAVRQIAHRARAHVAARRPGVPSRRPRPATPWTRSGGRSRPATWTGCSASCRGRGAGGRRWRDQAGDHPAGHRRRQGGPPARGRLAPGRRRGIDGTGAGQRLPGAAGTPRR